MTRRQWLRDTAHRDREERQWLATAYVMLGLTVANVAVYVMVFAKGGIGQ